MVLNGNKTYIYLTSSSTRSIAFELDKGHQNAWLETTNPARITFEEENLKKIL